MHDRVALTRCSLENLTILYVQLTASILNPVRRLQHTRGNCNARTPSAQPARYHFLSETQVAVADAIVKH